MLHHVSIEVDDLDAAHAFYLDLFGFSTAPRPESLGVGTWIDLGGATQLHLVVVNHPVARSDGHIAFRVEDADAWVTKLRDAGHEVSDAFDLGAGRQAFLRDPSGNLIEINQPTPTPP